MKEYPILFKGDLVRAILEGRKTQTRRIPDCCNAKWQVGNRLWGRETFIYLYHLDEYDQIIEGTGKYYYRADGHNPTPFNRFLNPKTGEFDIDRGDYPYWTPSIHMPREASRILLEITDIRNEYLQNITEKDAIAEGITSLTKDGTLFKWGIVGSDGYPSYKFPWVEWEKNPIDAFAKLWDTCASDGFKWADNPKIKVTTFKKLNNESEGK